MAGWNDDSEPTPVEVYEAAWCLRLVVMLGGFLLSGILLAIYFFSELRQPWMMLVGLSGAALSFLLFLGIAEDYYSNKERR